MSNFSNQAVNITSLRKKAYNYRWATLEEDVIPLTAADPDFPVAQEITAAITSYCADGYFSYCPPQGLPQFKEAIANWYQTQYQVQANAAHILPVNSAAHGLFIVAKALVQPHQNIIIPNPVDFLFRKSVEAAGAQVKTCPVNKITGEFNLAELASKIDSNTKAIFICNPNNPLGMAYSAAHLNQIIALAQKHNLHIVSDEIWADITFDFPTTSLLSQNLISYDKKIMIAGLSKNFGLAGLRIGYIVCTNQQQFDSIYESSQHASTAFGISGVSQAAGTAALNHAQYWLTDFKAHLYKMRQLTLQFVNQAKFLNPVNPNATYLAFPTVTNTKLTAEEVVSLIHQKGRVALVPGGTSWFESQSEGHLRICYATSESILSSAFERIQKIQDQILAD